MEFSEGSPTPEEMLAEVEIIQAYQNAKPIQEEITQKIAEGNDLVKDGAERIKEVFDISQRYEDPSKIWKTVFTQSLTSMIGRNFAHELLHGNENILTRLATIRRDFPGVILPDMRRDQLFIIKHEPLDRKNKMRQLLHKDERDFS